MIRMRLRAAPSISTESRNQLQALVVTHTSRPRVVISTSERKTPARPTILAESRLMGSLMKWRFLTMRSVRLRFRPSLAPAPRASARRCSSMSRTTATTRSRNSTPAARTLEFSRPPGRTLMGWPLTAAVISTWPIAATIRSRNSIPPEMGPLSPARA